MKLLLLFPFGNWPQNYTLFFISELGLDSTFFDLLYLFLSLRLHILGQVPFRKNPLPASLLADSTEHFLGDVAFLSLLTH